jgi:hypothetical protein
MLPSAQFEEVLAQDVLEHIPRLRTEETLLEWHRLVKPGGCLRLRVPNLLGLFELFGDGQRQRIDQQKLLTHCTYGTQAYEGDFHLAGFTPRLLTDQLLEVGFDDVQISDRDDWLLDALAIKADGEGVAFTNTLTNDAVCVMGWHHVESHEAAPFRWSKGVSLLNVRRCTGKTARLVFSAFPASAAAGPLRLELSDALQEKPLATLELADGEVSSLDLQVPADDFVVAITSSVTFVPRLYDTSSTDSRRLSAALRRLEVV